MGMPTPEELTAGPPIRVCGNCKTDEDRLDGGPPSDMSPRSPRGLWATCKRCGRRARFWYLIDRTAADSGP